MEKSLGLLGPADRLMNRLDTLRIKMIWSLLLFLLISSVSIFAVTPTIYETEENNNITIRLDSQVQTDMSCISMMCLFQSDGFSKIMFRMTQGAVESEFQDKQFSERVQCDRDPLRGGQITLQLSSVTGEDSGNYKCVLASGYDRILRRWKLETSETFVLNVTSSADEDSSDVLHRTTKDRLTSAEDKKQPQRTSNQEKDFDLACMTP
ncbi:uncharacterized protein KZ484_009202 isoform 2-T2 [Pholidichthys leucotaenia]